MSAGQASRARMLERLDAYAAHRDGGRLPVDAAEAMGLSETTAARYERWYRDQRGLPRRAPGFGEPMAAPVRGVFQ